MEDAKLGLILRTFEKARETLLNEASKDTLIALIKALTNETIFTVSLLELPAESRSLVSITSECIRRLLGKLEGPK